MPRQPLDHLPKVARTTNTTVILDTALADAYAEAVDDLTAAETALAASAPRRIAAARATIPVSAPDDELKAAVEAVQQADEAELEPLRESVRAAKEALEPARQRWVFKSLGRTKWKRLVEAHPPTEQDQAEWEADGGTGKAPYAFAPIARALIKDATIEPAVTAEQVDDMFDGDDWSDPELNQLWTAALTAQITARPDPMGRRR